MRRLAQPLLVAVTVAVVLGLGQLHGTYIGGYEFFRGSRFSWSLLLIALLCVSAFAVGLPEQPRDAYQAMSFAMRGIVAATLSFSAIQLVVGAPLLPRAVLFWSGVSLVPLWALPSFLAARGLRRQARRERVLAVLAEEDEELLSANLKRSPERGAVLVGVLSVDAAGATGEGDQPLLDRVQRTGATLLVLDRVAQADPAIVVQAARLHENGIRIRTLSLFYEEWMGKLPLSELERVALLFDISEIHGTTYARAKRLIDVTVALVGAFVLLALLPIVLVGDLLANRGPLFYRQGRVGKNGRIFTIFKLRTMRAAGADHVSEWTTEDDPRITTFGRVLRRSHVDELPQLLNVLRGDLSIVGPRPEQPQYVEELTSKIPFYALRHLVRPGLTGWAQVKHGYAGSQADALEKLQYEFFYLRHQGLAFDLRILARTLRAVVGMGGR